MEGFVKYCKDFILENIDNYEDMSFYACDFPTTITEGINANGTCTYSREKALDYLREWNWEAGEYFDWEKMNFGENTHNPFSEPEAYMVCMVIEGCNAILSKVPFIEENWCEEEIEFDSNRIDEIRKFVEDFDEDEDLF